MIIAVGGGSVMDTAKVAAVVAAHSGDVSVLFEPGKIRRTGGDHWCWKGFKSSTFQTRRLAFAPNFSLTWEPGVIKVEKPGGDSSREIGPFRTRTFRVKERANEDLFRWLNAAHSSL